MKCVHFTAILVVLCCFASTDARPAITNDLILLKHGFDIPKDILIKVLDSLLDPLLLIILKSEGPLGALYFSLLNLWFPHFTPLTNILKKTLQSLVHSNNPNIAQVINFLLLPFEAVPKLFTTSLNFLPFILILPIFGPFGFYLLWKMFIRHGAIQLLFGENISLLSSVLAYLSHSTVGFLKLNTLFEPVQTIKNALTSVAFAPEWMPFVARLPIILFSLFLSPISNFSNFFKFPGLEKVLVSLPPIFFSLLTNLPIIAILGPLGAFTIVEFIIEALFDFISPFLATQVLPFVLPFIGIFKTLNGVVSLFNPFQPLSLRLLAFFGALQFFDPFSNTIKLQLENIADSLYPLTILPFAFLPLLPGFNIFLFVFGPLLSVFGRILYKPLKTLLEFSSGDLLGSLLSSLRPLLEPLTPLLWILAPSLSILLPLLKSLLSPLDDTLKVLIPPLFPLLRPLSIVLGFLAPILVQYLGPLLTPLMPIVTTILYILAPLLRTVLGILGPLKSFLFPILGTLLVGVQALLNPILSLLGPIFGLLSPLLLILVPILSLVALLLGIIL